MAASLDFDVIVIGSGAGGLTAAVALAQAGKKVLVLEQHDRPGGWTHSFTLQGYRFSPGVPNTGDLHEGGGLYGLYEGLGASL
jgi:all-trans-retinol 13,14-reductase